MILFKMLLF